MTKAYDSTRTDEIELNLRKQRKENKMSQKFEVELEDETVNDLTQQAQNLSDSCNQRRQEEATRKEQ